MPQVGTLNGNPVASIAGLATLEVLREPGIYQETFARGRRLREGFQQASTRPRYPRRSSATTPYSTSTSPTTTSL